MKMTEMEDHSAQRHERGGARKTHPLFHGRTCRFGSGLPSGGCGGPLVAGLQPGLDAACHVLRLDVPSLEIFHCLTDSRPVVGSGTVEDDLPVERHPREPGFELGKVD